MTGAHRLLLYLVTALSIATLFTSIFLVLKLGEAVEGNRSTICGLVTLLSGSTVERQPGTSPREFQRGLLAFSAFFDQLAAQGVRCGAASDRLDRIIRQVREHIAHREARTGGGTSTTGSSPSSQPGPPQGGSPPKPPNHGGNTTPTPGQPAPQPTILDDVCGLVDSAGVPLC